jgi:hypothetical protein
MSDDRTKADKAWEARQEAARYRIFNAATNAAEATDEADDDNYFAVLDQAGNAAEAAAAEITGYKTYADLLEALDTRRKQRGTPWSTGAYDTLSALGSSESSGPSPFTLQASK